MIRRRKVFLAGILVAITAGTSLGAIIYVDDHFEGSVEPGWTLYGGARVANSFLFNDPYSPPSGELWGVGQDAWGATVDGGLYKSFYDHLLPNETKYFSALVEAYSVDWNFIPTPGHVGIRIGKAPGILQDPDDPGIVWTDWYWGDWNILTIEQPCIEGWETVFIDWFAPFATGPMVAKVDNVIVWQTPEPTALILLAAGVFPLLRRRK
jgi:hypothetical protein